MKPNTPKYRRLLTGAAILLCASSALAHIGYTGRDFGTIVPGAPAVTISNQAVSGNFGWADGTDDDFGDSHKLRAFRFSLTSPAYITVTFSASTVGGTRDGNLKPGFSVFQGLAHLPPISNAPGGSADHDGSAISLAYLATLGGVAKEGAFRAAADWRIGGDNQPGPTFDFEAADGLSTFVFKGYAVDGDSTLFGSAPGIVGDGVADGSVTQSFFLPAGDYSIFVGGANYSSQAPTPDATSYGLVGSIKAAPFVYTAGDPAEGGISYQHQVTIGSNSYGAFSSHVGAWSWEDDSLFDAGAGEPPVGWTHTSNWVALRVQRDTTLSITMARDANVPWPDVGDPDRKADTSSMFPSMTLFSGWDNDGTDAHTYNNRGNIAWAEDVQYIDHIDNSTEETITRTWYLPAGDYTLALGSNAPATNALRQGFSITFETQNTAPVDPAQPAGGIGYAHTIVAENGTSGSFSDHVGAWSWEDNDLFDPDAGEAPVGWTHTSKWVALRVEQASLFTFRIARDADVPWPSAEEPDRVADTSSMFPSFTIWKNWDNDGTDSHTYNNRGNVSWAEDLTYLDHLDNSSAEGVTRSYWLQPGNYTLAVGSNAAATNALRQGFEFSYSATAPATVLPSDPAAGGVPYAYTILASDNSSGTFSDHVGAWSWEDDSLFDPDAGEPPVGWTHTSKWVALEVTTPTVFTFTMARDANVPWPSAEEPNRKADTSSMFPSLTLYEGWDNEGADDHTFNNRGEIEWAEELSHIDHIDNSTQPSITRTWTMPPGKYTLALGSNAPATNTARQGFSFSFTSTPALRDPQAGGIGYAYTLTAAPGDIGAISNHVGAWSWEDDSLFSRGQPTVGWTHTSQWVALTLPQECFFTLEMNRDPEVAWPSPTDSTRKADTSSMFPSLTLYRGWDNDGTDRHTYANRGNVPWAEDLRYVDHVDNSTSEGITRTWRLPAGAYTLALGSNSPANNTLRQGFSLSYHVRAATSFHAGDAAEGGIGYSQTLSIGRGDSGQFSDHVGAWSWEDNSLFGPGQPSVGWTHTSRWVAVHIREPLTLNLTISRDAAVPWPGAGEPDRMADTTSMFPSFTLWRGWDNDDGDQHTYNNRGNVSWAEDLAYYDHCDNSSRATITRSYTLRPGYYTFAVGSNASSNNSLRQGFRFAWSTGAPVVVPPVIAGQPISISVIAGKKATLGVKAGGPNLEYQWLFAPAASVPQIVDGISNTILINEAVNSGALSPVLPAAITDGTSNTIIIDETPLEAAGCYVCVVRNAAGWSASRAAILNVIAPPVMNAFTIAPVKINVPLSFTFTATNQPDSFTLKSTPALPKGLTFNSKTGMLSGRALAAGAFALEVTAMNKAGTSAKVAGTLTIQPLADGAAGSFIGALERDPGINGFLGGCAKFEVTPTGVLSGSIVLGAKSHKISMVLDTALENPTATTQIPRPGQAPLTLEVTLLPEARLLFGSLHDTVNWLSFTARQRLTTLGGYPGNYTLALAPTEPNLGSETLPNGYGIGAFKVAATGTANGVLTLADKSAVTFSGSLEQGGNLTVFSMLYAGAGSVIATLNIQSDTFDLIASTVDWFKDAKPADRAYADGFGPIGLDVIGRKYVIPASGIALDLPAGAPDALLLFEFGGAPDPVTRLNVADVEVKAGSPKDAVITGSNPGKVKLSTTPGKTTTAFMPGTTGTFKGSFELTDTDTSVTPNKPAVRKADFQGVIVDDGVGQIGLGFFLLNQMPSATPKTTLTTSPILSGNVRLLPQD